MVIQLPGLSLRIIISSVSKLEIFLFLSTMITVNSPRKKEQCDTAETKISLETITAATYLA